MVCKWDVEVMFGKVNIEVCFIFINKGEIVKCFVNMYNVEFKVFEFDDELVCKFEFVFCMGDDFIDEDMFCVFNGLFVFNDGIVEVEVENIFFVIVGVSIKVMLVRWYVLEL